MIKILVVALVSATVLVAPSLAAANERVAAQAYADAALRLTQDVKAVVPGVRASLRMAEADRKKCRALDSYLARAFGTDRPTRRQLRVVVLIASRTSAALFRPLTGPFEQMLSTLDGVDTGDTTLRTGRALWRSMTNEARLYATYPVDICAQLATWYRAGAKGLPLTQVDLRGQDDPAAFGQMATRRGESPAARMKRVVARLRELGQGPRRAARFSGDEALEPVLEVVLKELESLLDELESALGS